MPDSARGLYHKYTTKRTIRVSPLSCIHVTICKWKWKQVEVPSCSLSMIYSRKTHGLHGEFETKCEIAKIKVATKSNEYAIQVTEEVSVVLVNRIHFITFHTSTDRYIPSLIHLNADRRTNYLNKGVKPTRKLKGGTGCNSRPRHQTLRLFRDSVVLRNILRELLSNWPWWILSIPWPIRQFVAFYSDETSSVKERH